MNKHKGFLVLIIGLAGLIVYAIYRLIGVPGQGETIKRLIWQSNQTPERFEQLLSESQWQVDTNKNYYLLSCEIEIKSFVPFSLRLLHAEPINASPNTRFYAPIPDFSYTLSGFERKTFIFTFLIEISDDQPITEATKDLQIAIYSEMPWRLRIPVNISGKIEEYTPSN